MGREGGGLAWAYGPLHRPRTWQGDPGALAAGGTVYAELIGLPRLPACAWGRVHRARRTPPEQVRALGGRGAQGPFGFFQGDCQGDSLPCSASGRPSPAAQRLLLTTTHTHAHTNMPTQPPARPCCSASTARPGTNEAAAPRPCSCGCRCVMSQAHLPARATAQRLTSPTSSNPLYLSVL